jgi:hypothetical protein
MSHANCTYYNSRPACSRSTVLCSPFPHVGYALQLPIKAPCQASTFYHPMLCRKWGCQLLTTPARVPHLVQQRWLRHGSTQEHVLGSSPHAHARSSSRAHHLLRFRLGCHSLPCVVGRRTGIPRHLRRFALCRQGLKDERHLVFECISLIPIPLRFQHLYQRGCTLSSFMNQDAQRDVMYFVTDCF